MIKKIILLIAVLLVTKTNVYSQDLFNSSTHSKYTYIYKLTKEHILILANSEYANITPMLINKVDSIDFSSNTYNLIEKYNKSSLPFGNYIAVITKENEIHYQLFSHSPIEVEFIRDKTEFNVFIHGATNRETITNAVVSLNEKSLTYDDRTQTYRIKKQKKDGIIQVDYQHETYIFKASNSSFDGRSFKEYSFNGLLKYKLNPFRIKAVRKIMYNYPMRFVTVFVHNSIGKIVRTYNSYYGNEYESSYSKYQYRINYFISNNRTGYIALNKPEYLPNDTLKAKAYITSYRGKAYQKEIRVLITKNNDYYEKSDVLFSAIIKPTSNGSYMINIPLKDTFKIDVEYNILFLHPKTNLNLLRFERYAEKRFKIRDYQLDETNYTAKFKGKKNAKEDLIFHKNEPIELLLKGEDVNGMNLLDGRASLVLKPKNIHEYLSNRVFIPDILWSKEITLENLGETKVTIPDSVFPNANMEVELAITFNNAANETHQITKQFDYTARNTWLKSELVNDEIITNLYQNNQIIQGKGWMYQFKKYNHQDTLIKTPVTYPNKTKLNTSNFDYIFTAGSIKYTFKYYEEEALIHLNKVRTSDTILFSIDNPRKLKLQYEIYRNIKEKLVTDTCTQLTKYILNPKQDHFLMYVHYFWNYSWQTKKINSFPTYDGLKITLDHPSYIYPGQSKELTVKVVDKNDEPLKNTNITAGAYNAQFNNSDEQIPNPPLLNNKYYGYKKLQPHYNIDLLKITKSRKIDSTIYAKFQLASIPYYQFRYPENNIYFSYDTIEEQHSYQFAPYIFDTDGKIEKIYTMHVNGKLCYVSKNDNQQVYSFEKPALSSDTISLKIRTSDRSYTIKSLVLKKGRKLNFSFSTNIKHPSIQIDTLKNTYSAEEQKEISNATLNILNNIIKDPFYLIQNFDTLQILKNRYNASLTIGPLTNDSVTLVVPNKFKHSFVFIPNYWYSFDYSRIIMKEKKPEAPGYLSDYSSYDLIKYKDEIKKFHTEGIEEQVSTQIIYPLYFNSNNQDTKLNIQTTVDTNFCLLHFQNLNKKQETYNFDPNTRTIYNLPVGNYSLIYITPENRRYVFDSVTISPNGTNYLFINKSMLKQLNNYFKLIIRDTIHIKSSNSTETKNGNGEIVGTVELESTSLTNKFIVYLFHENKLVRVQKTDENGNYRFKNIVPNTYKLEIISLYNYFNKIIIDDINVTNEKITVVEKYTMKVNNDSLIKIQTTIQINTYKRPLIDFDGGASGSIEIKAMACRNLSTVVSTIAGVSSDGMTIRGCASDTTIIFIDGIKVRGAKNLPKSAIEEIPVMTSGVPASFGNANGGIISLKDTIQPSNSNSIRSNFRDFGFWEPNLMTDEFGKATFKANFPDNITKWKLFAVGMNGRKSGLYLGETKAFNTISAQLSTPRFFVAGDEVNVLGKISNYAPNNVKIGTAFLLEDQQVTQKDTMVDFSFSEYLKVNTPQKDSITISYILHRNDGSKDGEKRSVPIFPKGSSETIGRFNYLEKDTVIEIQNKDTSDIYLYVDIDPIAPMLDLIKDLEDYPYYCMEQSSSKLLGLLAKQKIQEQIGIKFKEEKAIKKLIRYIEEGKNDLESWGWWKKGEASPYMTAYVLRALYTAKQAGYEVKDYSKAVNFLRWNLDVLDKTQQLNVLYSLLEINEINSAKNYYIKIDTKILNEQQQILLTRIRQLNGEKVDISNLVKKARLTQFDNIYWGENTYSLYINRRATTLLAYEIIRAEDSNSVYLPKIRNYFMESRTTSYDLNTIDKAQLLKTILPDYLKEYKNFKAPAQLTITGGVNQVVTEFPFKTVLKKGSELSIQKSGAGTVYLTTYQKHWNETPSVTDSIYKITSNFTQNGKRVDTLTAGVIAQLNVDIEVKKQGDYVFIEIPIPAGCSYDNNEHQRTYLESHREYFKNKTNIYYENLPVGKHRITIHVQPRFTGTFTLNPVKVERMYFPIFFGRNETKKIVQRNKN